MLCAAAPTDAVLLVDDDDGLRAALTFSLETVGRTVLAFASAEAALAAPLPRRACMVLDHRLPGLDGLQAFEALRGRGVTGPAIFITSHPKPALYLAAARAGAAVLEKPLLADALILAVRSAQHP